jgi:hypothetical protein
MGHGDLSSKSVAGTILDRSACLYNDCATVSSFAPQSATFRGAKGDEMANHATRETRNREWTTRRGEFSAETESGVFFAVRYTQSRIARPQTRL